MFTIKGVVYNGCGKEVEGVLRGNTDGRGHLVGSKRLLCPHCFVACGSVRGSCCFTITHFQGVSKRMHL